MARPSDSDIPRAKNRPARREPVDSSAIESIGYKEAVKALDVEFEGGAVYRYADVPPGVYRKLMAAQSKGRFVNYEIKPRYSCERIA